MFDLMQTSESMIADLESFVVPMELAVWLVYLEANNILEREESSSSKETEQAIFAEGDTRFIGNDFVERVTTPTPSRPVARATEYGLPRSGGRYEGRTYYGLHALDEYQSYYLFHKFAKHAFDQFQSNIPKSKAGGLGDFIHKAVKNKLFDDVLSKPRYFSLRVRTEK